MAHQVQLVPAALRRRGGMDRDLGRRQLGDQPAAPGVHGRQVEQVPQERPVGLGVGAVEDDVRAEDHRATVASGPAGPAPSRSQVADGVAG
jgi:hypothetical protein